MLLLQSTFDGRTVVLVFFGLDLMPSCDLGVGPVRLTSYISPIPPHYSSVSFEYLVS